MRYFILGCCIMLFFSCKENRNLIVNDFKSVSVDSLILHPKKNRSYLGMYYKIKGNIDDTLYIKKINSKPIILKGKIDTIFNYEYYGQGGIMNIFIEPYKAKKRQLEIDYGVNYYPKIF